MNDPYKVLGVPPTATDDEVKQAYRKLAKKYHPDANPNDKTAEQRMKEINAAYDAIVNKKANGGTQGGYGYGGYSTGYGGYAGGYGYGGYQQQQAEQEESPTMQAVHNFLNYGRYQEALNALSGIAEADRGAHWYYYSAIANHGAGNRMRAVEHAERALRMDPDNEEYQMLLQRLQNPSRAYGTYGRTYSMPNLGMGGMCLTLCMMQFLCRFCYC